MQFANPTAGGRIQAQEEPWDGTSIRVTRGCAGHQATGQGCALDLGDGRCDRPVLAVAAGTVTFRDNVQGIIRIAHGSDAQGQWSSEYAHMSPLLVSVGQQVTQGQQIGEIGDAHDPAVTNFSGCHLHFGIRLNGAEQDPWPYLNASPAGDDMDPSFVAVGNRTLNLAAGARHRTAPQLTAPVQIQAAAAGPLEALINGRVVTLPILGTVIGDSVNGLAQWFVYWRPETKNLLFIHGSAGTTAEFEPKGGITRAQLDAAVVAATDPLTKKIVAAKAALG